MTFRLSNLNATTLTKSALQRSITRSQKILNIIPPPSPPQKKKQINIMMRKKNEGNFIY
jgi:hypothetical protein